MGVLQGGVACLKIPSILGIQLEKQVFCLAFQGTFIHHAESLLLTDITYWGSDAGEYNMYDISPMAKRGR